MVVAKQVTETFRNTTAIPYLSEIPNTYMGCNLVFALLAQSLLIQIQPCPQKPQPRSTAFYTQVTSVTGADPMYSPPTICVCLYTVLYSCPPRLIWRQVILGRIYPPPLFRVEKISSQSYQCSACDEKKQLAQAYISSIPCRRISVHFTAQSIIFKNYDYCKNFRTKKEHTGPVCIAVMVYNV